MATTSAEQRRVQARVEYNAFLATCPSRELLAFIGSKWVALVLSTLEDGPRRHGEIARKVAGVSQKMLTQTLRELEHDGLVTRTVTPSVPVRVDYQLTQLGQSLQVVVRQVKLWAEEHMDSIRAARERSVA